MHARKGFAVVVIVAIIAIVLLLAAGYGVYAFRNRATSKMVVLEPRGHVVLERGDTEEDWYGDAYYIDGHGAKKLIARSKTVENGLAPDTFGSVFYTQALLSPNGQRVALGAACWEASCLEVYEVSTGALHRAIASTAEFQGDSGQMTDVEIGAPDTSWLPDNRLRVAGGCTEPAELCGTYESVNAEAPWMMQQTARSVDR